MELEMRITKITISGADDGIKPEDLIPINNKFPFIEWALLLSKSNMGKERYPSLSWMEEALSIEKYRSHLLTTCGMCFAGHLCGQWLRDLCLGKTTFITDLHNIYTDFYRLQLNFHNIEYIDPDLFLKSIKNLEVKNFIFQQDGINDHLLDKSIELGINASPLYDKSGGNGIIPDKWPEAKYKFNGYAGGLTPDNVIDQIEKIKLSARDKMVWLDVESGVRSNNSFDLDKVNNFLEKISPLVHPFS